MNYVNDDTSVDWGQIAFGTFVCLSLLLFAGGVALIWRFVLTAPIEMLTR